jgi:hypothetical protein
VETYLIIDVVLSHGTVDGSRFTVDGWAIAPDRPLGVLGDFFGLISVFVTSEKFGNDFEGLPTEK